MISRSFFIYFTIIEGRKSFVISKTSLYRGSLDRGSTILKHHNTIQILLLPPHGGFSETNVNSTGNQNKQKKKNTQELSINNY